MSDYSDPWGPGGRFIESGLKPVDESEGARGHSFFPAERVMDQIPRLYATEDVELEDKIVHLHYFVGGCDWYVMELDENRRRAFGYVNLNDEQNAELGYFDMIELESLLLSPHGYPVVVERDLEWTPRMFSETQAR